MNPFTFGLVLLVISATAWDMGMRALPLLVFVMAVLFILASITGPDSP